MTLQTGDLVVIRREYASDEQWKKWIGLVIGYHKKSEFCDEDEWLVQWSHETRAGVEYGYYLEVI